MDDLDLTIRRTYKALRTHASPLTKGRAWMLMKRERSRVFVAGRDGTLRSDDRVATLAELRLLMLHDFPAGYVGNFDR